MAKASFWMSREPNRIFDNFRLSKQMGVFTDVFRKPTDAPIDNLAKCQFLDRFGKDSEYKV